MELHVTMTIKIKPQFKKNKVFIPLKQHTFELGMRQSLTKAQKSFPEIQSLVHFKKKTTTGKGYKIDKHDVKAFDT